MIRKEITYKLLNNLTQNSQFWGLLVKLPNKPLLSSRILNTNDLIGVSISETIDNITNEYISRKNVLGLDNVLIRKTNDSLIIDFESQGAWGGYGDQNTYDPQYLVYESEFEIPRYVYSDALNNTVQVTTREYDTETQETPSELGVIGIESDNYLIDNDIYLKVGASSTGLSNYVDVTIVDMQSQKSVNSRLYYFNNNTLTFDLAIMIKSLMSKPSANFNYSELTPYPTNTNYGKYKIQLTRYYTPEDSNIKIADATIELQKTFIRGGIIDRVSNITLNNNTILRNCDKLPVWQGYPTAEYRLINGDIIQVNDLTTVEKEIRPQPDCNAYYFKFKNKKGGYSYWMFNKAKQETSVSNIGYSDVYGEITDFGSNVSRTEEVSGKIPYAFKGLVYDLLTSSETYLYNGGNKWQRVIQKSNKVSDNTNKRVIDITFKFDKIINYNPTV